MTITSIFSNALSGMNASQSALRVVSQNIANANTPGYVRADVNLSPQVVAGGGAGVSVQSVTRAADRFLAAAQRAAAASQGSNTVRADLLDQAQQLFGDPNSESTLFTAIDDLFTAFQATATDPASSVARGAAIGAIQDALASFRQAGQGAENLRAEADQRLGEAVGSANDLLKRIHALNIEVAHTRQTGADATTTENARDQLVDELSALIDVRSTPKADGRVELRTNSGALLVGDTAATLSYDATAAPYGAAPAIVINKGLSTEGQFDPSVGDGKIAGLIAARDVDLPGIADAISGLAAELADALNAVHATSAGAPPATVLAGRQTGLLATDALNFTGSAVIGLVDSSGVLQRRITVDFTNRQIVTENPADTRSFLNTVGDFATRLNEAMQLSPAQGTAAFSNGVLTLTGGGLVLGEGATASARGGRGFAHFFGLNDLVRSPQPTFYEAGVSGADAHGVSSGALSFQIRDANGRVVASPSVSVSGTTTWTDYIAALNNTSTGIGRYATAALDSNGRLTLTPLNGFQTTLTGDTTTRGSTGVSISSLFGIGRANTGTRALALEVNSAIVSNPSRLGLARPDLAAPIGTDIAEAGDARGADALVAARSRSRNFSAAGLLPQQQTTLELYASRLAGETGRLASLADRARTGADSVFKAATDRRAQVESVSLDEELVKMTQHQQSYAAASRVIQAAKEMLDVLLQI